MGDVINTQLSGAGLEGVFMKRASLTPAQVETDWFSWVVSHQKK